MTTSRRDVARMLQSYSKDAIETWARARGLDPRRVPASKLGIEVADLLLESRGLKQALAQTSREEQIALARLKLWNERVPAEELRAQLTADGIEDPDAVIASLMSRGLLFYDRTYESYGQNRWDLWNGQKESYTPFFWLPSEIEKLVTVPEDLGYLALEPAAEPPAEVREPAFSTLQRDIYLLLQALRENPVKLLKSGDVGKRDSQRLLQILPRAGAENDPGSTARKDGSWFRFLWLLLQHAHLIQAEPGRLVPSELGQRFLSMPEEEQVKRLLDGWREFAEWNEMVRAPTLAFDADHFGVNDIPSPIRVIGGRSALLALLKRQRPYPGWYRVPSLIASLKRLQVSMLIPRHSQRIYYPWDRTPKKEEHTYRGIYARGSASKQRFDKRTDWEQVEGAFFRTVLEESLFWLGVVRMGYEDGRLVSFALTERGAAALGLAPPPAVTAPTLAPGTRALVVQPNFEIVVYPEVAGVALLVELDRFAERVRMDQAALYRLTRAALCRGLQEGMALAEVVRLLETQNAGPLPQNVAYTLQEWGQLYERIHVRRSACLIEVSDDAELKSLRALPGFADAREIAPRVLLAPAGTKLPRLRQKTETIDYTAPILNALEFETATRFRVLPDAANPRLLHRVLQIADPASAPPSPVALGARIGLRRRSSGKGEATSAPRDAPADDGQPTSGVYTLSKQKVARVARWWKWEEINAFLAGTAKKKPGAELAIILKGWAGELAAPSLAPITVLAAPSASWLDQVMLVPEVKPLILQRLTPSLALVREEDRAKLEAELSAIGVTPAEGAQLGELLTAAGRADSADAEVFLVGPPRKRRALIEQAIALKRSLVIATIEYGSNRLNKTTVEPVRIEGEAGGAQLVARMPGHRYEYQYSLNRIQAVRMLDEAPTK